MCCAIEHAFNDPVYCIDQHVLKSAIACSRNDIERCFCRAPQYLYFDGVKGRYLVCCYRNEGGLGGSKSRKSIQKPKLGRELSAPTYYTKEVPLQIIMQAVFTDDFSAFRAPDWTAVPAELLTIGQRLPAHKLEAS